MKRMLLSLTLAILAIGVLPYPTCGQENKEPTTAELIRQLGSPKFRVRQRADELLRKRGPAILPALRQAIPADRFPRTAEHLARLVEARAEDDFFQLL